MSKRAFITGISGMDGSHLSEYLLELGYEVFGMVRRNSFPEHQDSRLAHIADRITLMYGDMTDQCSIENAIRTSRPDEIYNLAAMSHVRISFDIPQFTHVTNAVGVVTLLESARRLCPEARIYQASSSEMFGNQYTNNYGTYIQNENTPMVPVSPYGISKLMAYHSIRNYRASYKMACCNGILFNHTGPRRGANFVEQKIVKAAVAIKHGTQSKLVLGNLEACRDFGHSKDYVRAMHSMLNHADQDGHPIYDDYCIATGTTTSVRDICKQVFEMLGMNYEHFVTTDPKFLRPEELYSLCGDASKAHHALGWSPTYSLPEILAEMVEAADKNQSQGRGA